jgi:hypothetical protein
VLVVLSVSRLLSAWEVCLVLAVVVVLPN